MICLRTVMRNLIILLLLLVNALSISGKQNECPCTCSSEASLHFTTRQDTSMLHQLYYNGRIWVGKYFNVYGTEFIMEDKWYKTDIIINGIRFSDVEIKYDIYNDEVLANYYNKRIIILNNENIESFVLYTDEKELQFKNIKGTADLEGHYQVLFEGKSKLYKKWRKKRAQFVIEARFDEFQQDDDLILVIGERPYHLKNRRNLLNIMNDKKSEIKYFIRHENIRLDFDIPESLVPVLEYYDSL